MPELPLCERDQNDETIKRMLFWTKKVPSRQETQTSRTIPMLSQPLELAKNWACNFVKVKCNAVQSGLNNSIKKWPNPELWFAYIFSQNKGDIKKIDKVQLESAGVFH